MASIDNLIEEIVYGAESTFELDYAEDMLIAEIDEQAEQNAYPHYGHTTAQVFETAEEWKTWKLNALREALSERRAEFAAAS